MHPRLTRACSPEAARLVRDVEAHAAHARRSTDNVADVVDALLNLDREADATKVQVLARASSRAATGARDAVATAVGQALAGNLRDLRKTVSLAATFERAALTCERRAGEVAAR